MTSKERFLRTLDRARPDRPPVFATLTPQAARRLCGALGLAYEEPLDSLLSTRISHTGLLIELGNDCVGIAACAPIDARTRTLEGGILENEWGMRFVSAGLYNEFHSFPLAHAQSPDDIRKHRFPDPTAQGRFDAARGTVQRYREQYGVVADLECSVFETAWYLTGLEKLLVDLAMEAPYVPVLLDTILDITIQTGKELIRLGADMLWCGDDFGSQSGMILSPEMWRKWFKPRICRMFGAFRALRPDLKIAWHSCGSITPIIPDFIEIGLDILNPVQPLARNMDPEFLAREFGRDLVFFGGLDVQHLLPFGSPEQIKTEVRRMIEVLGRHGAYIIAPAHNIQDDTPVENVLALYEAVQGTPYR